MTAEQEIQTGNNYQPANSNDLTQILKKQQESLDQIRIMISEELGRQKMSRIIKFIIYFIIAAAFVISLITSYLFISKQMIVLREFTDDFKKNNSLENITESGIKSLKEELLDLNPF